MRPASKYGVVTFLDVLGWKGVYDRHPDAIDSLARLIEGVHARATEKQRGRILGEVLVKSISDTIAMFTFCSDTEILTTIEVHGELCQWLIPESIEAEIPVRGATAYGEFEIRDNIFVGKAVDEAAAWHEQADWIGVHLPPPAEYVFSPQNPSAAWLHYNPPNKNRLAWTSHCVNWTAGWLNRDQKVAQIKAKFRRLGPIVPDIAAKFANTLSFIAAMSAPNLITQQRRG